MKELVKAFNGHEVRTVVIRGEPWFVAKDVAEILGYPKGSIDNIKRLTDHVPEEWKGRYQTPTLGGDQEMLCFSEQGLYFFLARSNKQAAFPFQKWIAGEVLPSIRKTGKYDISDIKEKSTEARKGLTAEWDRQGVHGMQYATLTMEQSKVLFGNRNLKKAAMDRNQIKALMALEAVEQFKLSVTEEDKLGYYGCRDSMKDTAIMLDSIKKQVLLEATA
jgi:prophage antirepressor-like protein